MKVIILGAGQVGFSIATCLATAENDVTIIDKSPEVLKKVSDTLDVKPVLGYASNPDVLAHAGAEEANLFIAVTSSDDVNLVACELGHVLFKVEKKIARLRNQSFLSPRWNCLFGNDRMAVDVLISPEVEVARTIARSIQVPGAFDVLSLANNTIKVIGMRCAQPSVALNTPIRLLPTSLPRLDLIILYIIRDNQGFIPSEHDVMQLGDEVFIAVSVSQLPDFMQAFGMHDHGGRRLLIIGGGNIGRTLAREIEADQPNVLCKIIERSPEKAEALAHELHTTEVLCGDALDLDVLMEAAVHDSETVVTVTHDDKVNVLASLLSKREGARRAVTLLNNLSYAPLITSLGVDAIISPQKVTVTTILQQIRQGGVRSIYSLHNGEAELLECDARGSSHVMGLSIEDFNILHHVRVIALLRDKEALLDPSKQLIRANDRLILVAGQQSIKKIENLFAIRPSYL